MKKITLVRDGKAVGREIELEVRNAVCNFCGEGRGGRRKGDGKRFRGRGRQL